MKEIKAFPYINFSINLPLLKDNIFNCRGFKASGRLEGVRALLRV